MGNKNALRKSGQEHAVSHDVDRAGNGHMEEALEEHRVQGFADRLFGRASTLVAGP
jgi:hypothetical protein